MSSSVLGSCCSKTYYQQLPLRHTLGATAASASSPTPMRDLPGNRAGRSCWGFDMRKTVLRPRIPKVRRCRSDPDISSILAENFIFSTQNGPLHQFATIAYDPSDPTNFDFNKRILSSRYDGLLLRSDLEPRINLARQSLGDLRSYLEKDAADPGERAAVAQETSEQREKLLFVFDTFDRLETARRTAAMQLLKAKQTNRMVKERFLRTRAHLLDSGTKRIHKACSWFTKDFDDLEKHRQFLEKEISNINPKIERAERLNRALHGQISYVENYGPMIAEKLMSEEDEMQRMRRQKKEIEARLEKLLKKLEKALAAQDRGRDEIRHKRSETFSELQNSVDLLVSKRQEAGVRQGELEDRLRSLSFTVRKIQKLREKAGELEGIVQELQEAAEEKKFETEVLLIQLKDELTRIDKIRERQETEEAAALLDSTSSTGIVPSRIATKYLTNEQRRERIRIRKQRREKREEKRKAKQERQQKALDKTAGKLRVQLRDVSDRVAELLQTKLALEPQLDRLAFLEETFQKEQEEKVELRGTLKAELRIRETELREAHTKLEQLQNAFRTKMDKLQKELDKSKKLRIEHEKKVKEINKLDMRERKRLAQQLKEQKVEFDQAKAAAEEEKSKLAVILARNKEISTELAEVNLAVKVAYQLIPGDEAKRLVKQTELEEKTDAYKLHMRTRYKAIVDKFDLCSRFAKDNERLRATFARDLHELRHWVLILIQEEKMKFHKEFSCYQLLMWRYRRYMELNGLLVQTGNDMRTEEQGKVMEMYRHARTRRGELAEACEKNGRVMRTLYHFNVAYHILHIENVREYFRNYAAEDNYHSAVEIALAEKVFCANVKQELKQRKKFWSYLLKDYYTALAQQTQAVTDTQEHALQTSDTIWEELKTGVIEHQNIPLDDQLRRLLAEDFRGGWDWKSPPADAGDGVRYGE